MDNTAMDMPPDIAVTRFAAARAQEIATLTEIIENPENTKLIFQKLPCHMRRRAMSHNPKRMPRRLIEAHKAQMAKSGTAAPPKRPRRKYRRRPSNLLKEYQKRNTTNRWMETHIWHAKRFHMSSLWGCNIPYKSCNRSFRFCYRSTAHFSILMDVSYLCCLELQGTENDILAGLDELCSSNIGLTFRSAAFLSGRHQGSIVLYERHTYPRQPIGTVTFLWRPLSTQGLDATNDRSLWLWAHPAFYLQLVQELNNIFGLDGASTVKLVDNRGKLNRFRLRGPLSYDIISSLFADTQPIPSANVTPGFVYNVSVRDPRLTLPVTKIAPAHIQQPPNPHEGIQETDSLLWDAQSRDKVSSWRQTVPDHAINERRRQFIVPGSVLPRQNDDISVPLVIVNAPHEGNTFVTGCDVIMPADWATAFWIWLVYNGCHAGGLSDAHRMNFEYGICKDLVLEIDSRCGKEAAERRFVELTEKYFKKPPKCRVNHIKMGTPFPFGIDWNRLAIDWSTQPSKTTECSNYYVCRDRAVMQSLVLPVPQSLSTAMLSDPCRLIRVTVIVTKGGGCPQDLASICLPSQGDSPTVSFVEPLHKDVNFKDRKSLRQQHRLDLKQLARKRKKDDASVHSNTSTNDVYKQKMRSLWMPNPTDLKTFNQRPIVGFVVQGDYALSQGRGVGNGYISAVTLPLFSGKMALVRNPGSDHYLWAEIKFHC